MFEKLKVEASIVGDKNPVLGKLDNLPRNLVKARGSSEHFVVNSSGRSDPRIDSALGVDQGAEARNFSTSIETNHCDFNQAILRGSQARSFGVYDTVVVKGGVQGRVLSVKLYPSFVLEILFYARRFLFRKYSP